MRFLLFCLRGLHRTMGPIDGFLIRAHLHTYLYLLDRFGLTVAWYRRIIFGLSTLAQMIYPLIIWHDDPLLAIIASGVGVGAEMLVVFKINRYDPTDTTDDRLQAAGKYKAMADRAFRHLIFDYILRIALLFAGIFQCLIGTGIIFLIPIAVSGAQCVIARDRDEDRFKRYDRNFVPSAA